MTATASEMTGSPVYAGFWRRAIASVVDGHVFLGLALVAQAEARTSMGAAMVAYVLVNVACLGYVVGGHALCGQTIGKMVTRIRVVQLDLRSLEWRHALLRSIVDIVFTVCGLAATLYACASWAGPEWSSLSEVDRGKWLATRDPTAGVFVWASWIWLGSEILVLLTNEKRRALHDFIAGTVVVRLTPALPARTEGLPSVT